MRNSVRESFCHQANTGPEIVMSQNAIQNKSTYTDLVNSVRSLRSANALVEKEVIKRRVMNVRKLENSIMLMKRLIRIIIGYLIMISMQSVALAKDFGIKGHVYKIEEQPFLQMIDERLKKVDMEKEKKKMQALAKDRVKNPRAVDGISSAKKDRSFYWDPTYTEEKDIILPCGKLLHKAGTKVNPLDHLDFDRRLFVIDARNGEQVDWLKSKLKENLETNKIKVTSNQEELQKLEDRIILVGGKPFDLAEELKAEGIDMTVYFDQIGEITGRFGIKYTPALAYQEDKRIRIDQFNLGEK